MCDDDHKKGTNNQLLVWLREKKKLKIYCREIDMDICVCSTFNNNNNNTLCAMQPFLIHQDFVWATHLYINVKRDVRSIQKNYTAQIFFNYLFIVCVVCVYTQFE